MSTRSLLGSAIAVILVVTQHKVELTSTICDNPSCVQESAKIIDYVNPNVNPCNNFHEFACGNFVRNANGNEYLEYRRKSELETIDEIIGAYQDPIRESDHKMVKVAKKLYRSCMNRWQVVDDLKTVKEILKSVGGWPILEGSSWNEENFDWINATYKLRRLGYDYSAVLTLYVEADPYSKEEYVLKIEGPYVGPDTPNNIKKVAALFGTQEENGISKDIDDVGELLAEIDKLRMVYPAYRKQTVEQIQNTEGVIDWLEFINNLAGPKVQITKDNYVIFPTKQYVKQIIDLMSKTPKRVQANYMLYTAIKPFLRFLPNCPATEDICDLGDERRVLCLLSIHSKLLTEVPNPIDVIRLRRYLPERQKKRVEELVSRVKSVFVEYVNKTKLLPDNIKQTYVDRLQEAKVVVGIHGNYFDDKMLDESNVDMVDIEDDASFFTLVAQVQRNFKSAEYSKLGKPVLDYNYGVYLIESKIPHRYEESNIFYVPLTSMQPFFYNENRPEYINYGVLGTLVASQLSNELISYMEQPMEACKSTFLKAKDCLDNFMDDRVPTTVGRIIANHVSYTAYEDWVKNKGEGHQLIATEFTPKQLFWISAARIMCHPVRISQIQDSHRRLLVEENLSTISASISSDPNFAEDFNCPVNSKLLSRKECNIF